MAGCRVGDGEGGDTFPRTTRSVGSSGELLPVFEGHNRRQAGRQACARNSPIRPSRQGAMPAKSTMVNEGLTDSFVVGFVEEDESWCATNGGVCEGRDDVCHASSFLTNPRHRIGS